MTGQQDLPGWCADFCVHVEKSPDRHNVEMIENSILVRRTICSSLKDRFSFIVVGIQTCAAGVVGSAIGDLCGLTPVC